jgi:uncharacterized C2H2 Zn-finger protein
MEEITEFCRQTLVIPTLFPRARSFRSSKACFITFCPVCNKAFKGKKAMLQHQRDKHHIWGNLAPKTRGKTCRGKSLQPNAQKKKHLSGKTIHGSQCISHSLNKSKAKMQINCPFCAHIFHTEASLAQHKKAKHAKILIDENLSSGEPITRNIAFAFDQKLKKLPKLLKGQKDEEVIRYAQNGGMGLITCDKLCARKAIQSISPVFLLIRKKGQTEVIKLN